MFHSIDSLKRLSTDSLELVGSSTFEHAVTNKAIAAISNDLLIYLKFHFTPPLITKPK